MPDSPRFSPEDPNDRRRQVTRFGAEPAESTDQGVAYVPDEPKRGCLGKLLIGCLVTLVILVIIAVIVGYWISQHWRGWAADLGSDAARQMIARSELPDQEKAELQVQVDRVAQALRDGKLGPQQVQRFIELLQDSPLMAAIVVGMVETKYFDHSGLSDPEKKDGLHELRRFARGVVDGDIPDDKRDDVLQMVAQRDRHGNWQPRDHMSDDELRALVAAAKTEADAANIAAEPEAVDPSDELQRIVDETLGEP